MPTTIYDSSQITQRRRDKAISNSFITRIQNPTNPNTGYAPYLGISQQSIINTVKMGQMPFFRKNDGGCTTMSVGCPCGILSSTDTSDINPPIPPISLNGWVTRIGSNAIIFGNTTDIYGNVYVVGRFESGNVTINNKSSSGGTINPIPYGIFELTGTEDTFIVKYNTNGEVVWATTVIGYGNLATINITTDTSANIYISGIYENGDVEFRNFVSGGDGGIIQTTRYALLQSSIQSNIFLAKYDTSGQVQWVNSIEADPTGFMDFPSIFCDNNNNVYISTTFDNSDVTINNVGTIPNPIPIPILDFTVYGTIANIGMNDVLFVKYNSNGVPQWANSISGTGSDRASSIRIDSSNNIYLAGTFDSPTITINNPSTPATPGGIITPIFYGTTDLDGTLNIFLIKYNSSGNVEWVNNTNGNIDTGFGFDIDNNGFLYINYNYYSDPITINNASNSSGLNITPSLYATIAQSGSSFGDSAIVKYDTNGAAIWATNTTNSSGTNIVADNLGSVYITGVYESTSMLINNTNTPVGNVITPILYGNLNNSGDFDCFVIKYSDTGSVVWVNSINGIGFDVATRIAVDSSSNVFLCGYFFSPSITINDASTPVTQGGLITPTLYGTLSNTGIASNGYLIKYNSNGLIV
jgi:hypothetical protein